MKNTAKKYLADPKLPFFWVSCKFLPFFPLHPTPHASSSLYEFPEESQLRQTAQLQR